jgi:transposase-like protein
LEIEFRWSVSKKLRKIYNFRRVIDLEDKVLEIITSKRRDSKAGLVFFKKLMRHCGKSKLIITAKLSSYSAATKVLGNMGLQKVECWGNN